MRPLAKLNHRNTKCVVNPARRNHSPAGISTPGVPVLTLDSLGSRNEDEPNVRLGTPESSESVASSPAPILRELLVDEACGDLVRGLLSGSNIKLHSIDLAALLASGAAASLAMFPLLFVIVVIQLWYIRRVEGR